MNAVATLAKSVEELSAIATFLHSLGDRGYNFVASPQSCKLSSEYQLGVNRFRLSRV